MKKHVLRFPCCYKGMLKKGNMVNRIIVFSLFLLASTAHGFAQQQGFRWGKWAKGQTINNKVMDEIVDSHIDSAGNTYIFGKCGMSARLGGNGPYINPMDSITGYSLGNIYGVFLAKIDTLGNILWCKSARGSNSNSPGIPWNNMVVKDNRITIAFDFHWGSGPGTWFYFFDTLITISSDMFTISKDATYFVTFDLDGNRLDYHSIKLYAYSDPDHLSFCPLPFGHLKSSVGNFLVDENDNIHIFACSDFFDEDSIHKAYIIVDGDTVKRYPLNIKTLKGETFNTSMYFKMDREWNMIGSRFMIDSISVWNPDGRYRAYIEFKKTTIVDDEIYANCIFYNEDYNFNPDTLPVRVFLDSVHYLRIDNTQDWQTMPCLLKLNRDGEVVWTQQLYNEQTTTTPNNYMALGGVATDTENVYVLYKPSWVNSTRFYIDSVHSIRLPLVSDINASGYCLVVSYNRNTASPVDYYIADTVNKNESNTLAIIGDELLLDVDYKYDLKKTELCKINKYTKDVTWTSPIQYNFIVECKNMTVSSQGCVFRGEKGDEPRVYDSIFLGNYQEASVMAFFYDSTLDMRRPQPCYGVDTLWSAGTAGHTVTLSWHSPFPHPRYELAYIPDGGSWDDATLVETTDTTATVVLPDGQCHLFRVRGLCDGNRVAYGPWSHTVTVCPQVGIGDAGNPSPLTLSPNPTDGAVQILGLQGRTATVEILDMTGHVLATFEKNASFDITALPSGVYTVRVKTTHGGTENSTTLKLVKK